MGNKHARDVKIEEKGVGGVGYSSSRRFAVEFGRCRERERKRKRRERVRGLILRKKNGGKGNGRSKMEERNHQTKLLRYVFPRETSKIFSISLYTCPFLGGYISLFW